MLSFLLTILLVAAPPDVRDGPSTDEFDALREEFLASINAERARAGVPPLRLSAPLSRVAQELADESARGRNTELSLTPEAQILARAEKAGYSAKSLAEIFTRADGSVAEVTAFWRERGGRTWTNMLRDTFRDLGIGVAIVEDVPLYVFLLGVSW